MKWKHYIINSTSKLRDTMMGYGNAARPQPLQTVCRQFAKESRRRNAIFLQLRDRKTCLVLEMNFETEDAGRKCMQPHGRSNMKFLSLSVSLFALFLCPPPSSTETHRRGQLRRSIIDERNPPSVLRSAHSPRSN